MRNETSIVGLTRQLIRFSIKFPMTNTITLMRLHRTSMSRDQSEIDTLKENFRPALCGKETFSIRLKAEER